MSQDLSFSNLIKSTGVGAQQVIAPTLSFALGFAVAVGILVWAGGALPGGTVGSVVFPILVFATLYMRCLFSAAMYNTLLVPAGTVSRSGLQLVWAWLLIIVVAAIMATIILLFFSLIGSSLGVAATETGQDITDMTRQMREGGTFYPLFALFILTLLGVAWFAARIMLFSVATVAQGRVHVFRTWFWTKGHVRTLLPGAVLFVVLPFTACAGLASAALGLLALDAQTPVQAGLGAALAALCLTPAAWLGHAFSAAIYQRLAPAPESANA